MDVPPADHSYLTIEQFCKRTTLSESTIRRRIKEGSLKIWQPGGKGTRVLIAASQLFQPGEKSSKSDRPLSTGNKPVPSHRLPGPVPRWKKL